MSGNSLPPVRHLPHWSRIGCLDLPHQRPWPATHVDLPSDSSPAVDRVPSCRDMDVVASLQRNIQFLQLQHKETLQKLHGEIDELRRENKELQYKLIMEPSKYCREGSSCRNTKLQSQRSENQAQRGLYPEHSLEDTRTSQDPGLRSTIAQGGSVTPAYTAAAGVARQDLKSGIWGGLITSLKPLRIHRKTSPHPRTPTLPECEVVIRQLYNANRLQSLEITRLKSVLRGVVFNKITPENHKITKAYLADSTSKTDVVKLPQIATLPKRMSGNHTGVTEKVILPSIKDSVSSSTADRQKRPQAVQRSRLRRTVH